MFMNMLVYNLDVPNAVNYRNAGSGFVHYIHGVNPLVQRNMRPLEDRSGTNREVQLALIAAVVATLAGRDTVLTSTGGASHTVRPKPGLQIHPCSFLIGEHLEELQRTDCALAHESNSR